LGRADIDELRIDCTALAAKGGDDKLVSVVALGVLVSRLGWVSVESVEAVLREMVGAKRPQILQADLGAFAAGVEAGRVVDPLIAR
jgi:Pyruvate/2-oxoacid:ferredoxin oxidoreductase gamma subunit